MRLGRDSHRVALSFKPNCPRKWPGSRTGLHLPFEGASVGGSRKQALTNQVLVSFDSGGCSALIMEWISPPPSAERKPPLSWRTPSATPDAYKSDWRTTLRRGCCLRAGWKRRGEIRHEVVTHVLGTTCYLCVRAGHDFNGERGGTRTHDPMIKS